MSSYCPAAKVQIVELLWIWIWIWITALTGFCLSSTHYRLPYFRLQARYTSFCLLTNILEFQLFRCEDLLNFSCFTSLETSVHSSDVLSAGESLSGTPLTTSARISALNIVGELLRKVGVRASLVVFEPVQAGAKRTRCSMNEPSHTVCLSAADLPSCEAAGCCWVYCHIHSEDWMISPFYSWTWCSSGFNVFNQSCCFRFYFFMLFSFMCHGSEVGSLSVSLSGSGVHGAKRMNHNAFNEWVKHLGVCEPWRSLKHWAAFLYEQQRLWAASVALSFV